MKNFWKRAISFVLAVLMFCGSAPQIVSAMMTEETAVYEEHFQGEHIYSVDSDSENNPNPSNDPFLSQAEYWEGYILTQLSHIPVVREDRAEHWTYTDVPIEENTEYFSKGATRIWFLDEDKNPISTLNARTESKVQFTFTTPENCAYFNVQYNPDFIKKGTETILKIYENDNETDDSCIKIWEQWIQPVTLTAETYPTYGGSSTGYYEKGKTFGGIIYSSTFRDGTDVLWNLNPSTYYSAVANPASLLYTVDYRGKVSTESSWAGSVCNTTALKACGYKFPYSTAEIPEGFTEKTDHSIDNLEFGDILWVKGHVAGIIGVKKFENGEVFSVKIIEQSSNVKVFEITAENWDSYFESHWTKIYYSDFDTALTKAVEYSENLSIIFERGNNTYVTDYSEMLFYIPEAEQVFFTKDGKTEEYAKTFFPTKTVNGTAVYNLASLFDGTGDYYFHTEKDETDICIKVISKGNIEISGKTAVLGGYENCTPLGYRVIKIVDETQSKEYNFFGAPEGYTSEIMPLSFRTPGSDVFEIENIPEDTAGWKLEVFYDTGYGWARELSENILDSGNENEIIWEQGTIAAATGLESNYANVVRNKGYLKLSDYAGITLNGGHYLTYFVYDKDYNYLGNGKADLTANFLLSGEGISTKEMLIRYPEGVYFRIAFWRGKSEQMTVDMVPDSGIRLYDAEYGPVIWEMGSIYAKSGITFVREQVIRCISYLPVEDYVGVGIGKGYAVGYLAYDENLNYLGNGNPDLTGYFVTNGFYTKDILENYPETKYIKLIFREDPIADFTMDAVETSGVRVYKNGEEFELPEPELKSVNIMTMNRCQDGAVYDDKVFLFNSAGKCSVYDIETETKIGSFTVDKVNVLNPHANSVCFGSTYYEEGDKYPLLYVNIYNNYKSYADKREGTCCVYRITEENGVFGSKLVQVIKIGFTDDYDLWNSAENNGYEYYLPYGNFVVDTDKDKLWAFVLRNGEEQTRFFKFDLPEIGDGVYNETYGCNLVTLESKDIIKMFDTEHLVVIQGCCYYGGKILSVTGLGKGTVAPPFIQVIDPAKGEIEKNLNFEEIGITNEPEMISVDPVDGTIYYASVDGILRKLEINTKFHDLRTKVTLGEFVIGGVGKTALNSSKVLLSQKTLIAVPYMGAELILNINDGYQVRVHSGNNNNNISSVSEWFGADGDGISEYRYVLPENSIYMRLSVRKIDGSEITAEDLEKSGVALFYKTKSDIIEENKTAADVIANTDMPVIMHISDIHGDTIRAERAAFFAEQTGAEALLASGDLTAYEPDDWGNALFDSVDNYPSVNFIYGIGNHDAKVSSDVYQEMIYNNYFKNNISTPNGETYYYRDIAGQKLRIISVNQQEGASTTANGGTCYSQKQVDWLVETLKTTPEDYGVILVYHSPESKIKNAGDPGYPKFFQTENRYDNPTNSYSNYTGTLLADLVDAFMMRKSFSWNYSEGNGSTPVTVNADFTDLADGVEFIAHVTGHVHSDSVTYLPGTACKQLLLGVTCTTAMYGEEGGYYGLADYSDLNRLGDTPYQDAFNAYIIDRENKNVRVLRIGANKTVDGKIRDDMIIPYSIPFKESEYLFDTEGLTKLDLSDVEWVNYGIQAYGIEQTYLPGLRWSPDMIFDVPYEGVTFYIKINAPYEMGIRSGKTDTTMETNHYWLNNKELSSGNKNQGYSYTLPKGHTKFIFSVADITRDSSGNVSGSNNPVNRIDLQAAGLEIWYKVCNHSWDDVVTAPTCISQGYTTHICKDCGFTYTDSHIPASGHKYFEEVCSVCGASEKPEYPFNTKGMTKLDIYNVEWVNYGIQAYGTEPAYYPGQRMSTNKVFDVPYEGVTFYVRINSPYEIGIRSGTTDTTMETNYYWINNKDSVGNKNQGFKYTVPEGHQKFIISMANVTRDDSTGNIKTDKNEIGFSDLAASDIEIWYECKHSYESVVTEPTCTEQGYTTYICEICGDSYVNDYVEATHTFGEWVQHVTTGCGVKYKRECGACGEVQYAKDTEARTISFSKPAITANVGDVVTLSLYSISFDDSTVTSAEEIEWVSEKLEITNGYVIPAAAGVYELTATANGAAKTIYLLVKKPEDTEYVLYSDSFEDESLDDYRVIEATNGAQHYISDGKLVLDAYNNINSYLRILLPDWIGDFGDYEITTSFTITRAKMNIMWFSVMTRIQENDFPYWQATARYHAAASNGVEINNRIKASGAVDGWVTTHSAAFTENISPFKYYYQTFALEGSESVYSIDGTTLLKSETMTYGPGDVGFQVRGATALVDSVKIVIPDESEPHLWGEWIVTDAPTCLEKGTETRKCINCGVSQRRDIEINHDVISYAEKMHTCTEIGWTAYESCKLCDYTTYAEASPYGHSFEKNVRSVAHRGYSQTAPENTLAAYRLAKELGYMYVEGDVFFTKDGVPVMLHDDTIDRTSNGKGKVSELTYEQLLKYDFGSWKSDVYAGTKIPTFEEYIALCAELELIPYIELKIKGEYTREQVQQLVKTVEKYGMEETSSWVSQSWDFLNYVKEANPVSRLGYIQYSDVTQKLIAEAKKLRSGSNEVFLLLDYKGLSNSGVLRASVAGVPLETYTVNSENAVLKLPGYISGVISDSLNAQSVIDKASIAVTEPTCTEQGYTTYTCIYCGESYIDNHVPALGHTFDEWYTVTEASCSEAGEERRDCKNCEHYETKEVPELGHDEIAHAAKAATCTEIGWEAYVTCSRCDYTTYVEIPELGHNEVTDAAKAPTCTETGLTEGKHCPVCGEILVKQESIDAHGHIYSERCDEICNICGNEREIYHDKDKLWSADAENHWHACTCCKTAFGTEKHNFIDGICSVCTYEKRFGREMIQSSEKLELERLDIDNGDFSKEGYFNEKTGELISSSGYRYSEEYYDISGAEKLFLGYTNSVSTSASCPRVFFYDVNYKYISMEKFRFDINTENMQLVQGYYGNIIEIPENAEYARFATTKATTHLVHYFKVSGDYVWKDNLPSVNALRDKTIVFFGDSIIGNHSEVDNSAASVTQLLRQFGAETINAAFGGTWLSERNNSPYGAFSMVELAESVSKNNYSKQFEGLSKAVPPNGHMHLASLKNADWENVDYIIIAQGTNDFNSNVIIDNNDPYAKNTIKGALRFIIETINNKYPHIQIVLCTVNPRFKTEDNGDGTYSYLEYGPNKNGDTLGDYANAFNAVAEEYDLVCVDLYNNSFSLENAETYFNLKDGTHPNLLGRWKIAEKIVEELGHNYEPAITLPACTEQGYTTHTCSVCGDSYVDSYVEEKGHSFGEWYTVTEATPTEAGEERRDCENCEHYETQEIPPKGYEIGDINLDGKVDVMDAYYIRLVVAKLRKPTEQQILLGDVDGDGKITAIDANIIRKFAVKIISSIPVAQ